MSSSVLAGVTAGLQNYDRMMNGWFGNGYAQGWNAVNNPLSTSLEGIRLAQTGRTMEALAYLREAVQSEPVNAEVWLWLAHVTTDMREYQNCVYQALQLQPNHLIARQMQAALMQGSPGQPVTPPYDPATGYQVPYGQPAPRLQTSEMNPAILLKAQKKQRRRWFLRRVAIFAIIGIVLGILAALMAILAIEFGLI